MVNTIFPVRGGRGDDAGASHVSDAEGAGSVVRVSISAGGPTVDDVHRAALRSIARVVRETTPATPPERALEGVVELLRRAPALVLTGAGVSTGSGIPDYRGPRGSLRRHRPMTYQEFSHDPGASHRYWARSFVGWRLMHRAEPNPVHLALAELERAGYVSGIVTQNVDGLHQAAGSARVLELHGSLERVVCLDCGTGEDRTALDARLEAANPGYLESVELDPSLVNPDGDVELSPELVQRFRMVGCLACGSQRLKPDVVYFGEPVPAWRKREARRMLEASGDLLVVGSSLAVMSGYRIVLDGLARGRELAVINAGPGRADARAGILWRTGAREALDAVLDVLEP